MNLSTFSLDLEDAVLGSALPKVQERNEMGTTTRENQ